MHQAMTTSDGYPLGDGATGFQMPANAGRDPDAVAIRAEWKRQATQRRPGSRVRCAITRPAVTRRREVSLPSWNSGEGNPRSKLTAAQVIEIRRRYDGRQETLAAIAADYGITQVCVSHIGRGDTWRHLPEAVS